MSIRDWRNAAVVFVLLSIVSVLFFYVSKRLRVQYREFGRISVSHQVCQGKIQVGLNANLSVQALQKPYEQVVRSDKTRHVGRFLLSEFAAFMPSAVAVQKIRYQSGRWHVTVLVPDQTVTHELQMLLQSHLSNFDVSIERRSVKADQQMAMISIGEHHE